MKKNLTNIAFITICLLSSSCYAYIAGKVKKNDTLIYCPSQIVCTEPKNLNSCSYDNTFSNYWNKSPNSNNKDEIIAGTYSFASVNNAGYHSSNFNQTPVCIYTNSTPSNGNTFHFYLKAKTESNLEAYTDKDTAWAVTNVSAYCPSKLPMGCPMIQQSALEIINYYSKDGVWAAIENMNVIDEKVPFSNEQTMEISYKKVIFDNILYSCGGAKNCKIDIKNTSGDILGSVSVDMDDHMKIIEIINMPYSNSKIEKIDPFNTISIKSNIPPVNYSIELYNYTNTDITPVVGYVDLINKAIANGKHDTIYLDRAFSACKTNGSCQINIRNSKQSVFGSINVDLSNNMKILGVVSTYPSEITVNQSGTNSVEVKYVHKI